MDCEKARELIFRAADGALSADEQTALNAHLAECSECRAVCDALAAVSTELRETECVPEGFAARVMDAVREETKIVNMSTRREKRKKLFRPENYGILAACACFVIIVGVMAKAPPRHIDRPAYLMADQAAVYEAAAESAVAEEAYALPAAGEDAAPAAEEAAPIADTASLPAPEMPAPEPAELGGVINEAPAEESAVYDEAEVAVNGAARGADTPDALVPALMVNGTLYRSTGTQLPVEPDDSAILGCVSSVVPLSQWPEAEGQANFGEPDAPYALIEDGLIVLMDGEWTLFEAISE